MFNYRFLNDLIPVKLVLVFNLLTTATKSSRSQHDTAKQLNLCSSHTFLSDCYLRILEKRYIQ